MAPRIGAIVGARKWSWSTSSRRSTSTATLTTVKAQSSSRTVVSAREAEVSGRDEDQPEDGGEDDRR